MFSTINCKCVSINFAFEILELRWERVTVQQNENDPNIVFGCNILILSCIVCRQTHLFFCAILVVCDLIEQGCFPPVVATNRVDIAFHLGKQLLASLVLFSIGHSLRIFAGYHVTEIERKC